MHPAMECKQLSLTTRSYALIPTAHARCRHSGCCHPMQLQIGSNSQRWGSAAVSLFTSLGYPPVDTVFRLARPISSRLNRTDLEFPRMRSVKEVRRCLGPASPSLIWTERNDGSSADINRNSNAMTER